jgi:MFS family permease
MTYLLSSRSFCRLYVANLLSMLGSQISRFSIILYIFHDTNNVENLILLIILETLPGALVAPFSGTFIDRFDKRKFLILSDIYRMIIMVVILIYPKVLIIYFMAALHSVGTVCFELAKNASVPLLVAHDDLPKANGIDQSSLNMVMILGPILGAELFRQMGLTATLIIDAGSFLLSAILIKGIQPHYTNQAQGPDQHSTISGIVQGWGYLVQHRLALHLVSLSFVSLLCVGLWLPLAPFFIRDFLGGSDVLLGVQTGVFGLGGVCGAFCAPRLTQYYGKGLLLWAGLLGESLTMTVYAFIPNISLSVLICFLWGVHVSLILVPYYSIIQETVHAHFLGRVLSVAKQGESLAMLLAMVLAIGLQQVMSADQIYAVIGGLYFAIVASSVITHRGKVLLRTV